MAENKKAFILYADLITVVEKLVLKDRENKTNYSGELFLHILKYVNDQNPIPIDFIIEMAFEPIKLQLKRDLMKYKKTVEDKSYNGRLGNLKRWNLDLYNKVISEEIELEEAENIAKNRKTSHSDTLQSLPIAEIADTDNDTVTDNDTDINILNYIPQNQKNDFKAEVDLNEIEVIDEECLVGDAHWGTKLKVVEEKEKSSEKKEKEFSSEVLDCYSECLGYFDPSLHPKKKDIYYWLDTIEKLNRLEHLQFSDIVLIVKKAREDEFWSKNFLSLTKLRRKDKDKIPYWRVFVEKFKNTSPNAKLQKMNAGEIIKAKYGL